MSAHAILTVLREGELLREVNLVDSQEVILGRSEDCLIRLQDRAVSRQHAAFKLSVDGIQLEKKSEFGPIQLNGAECTRALLKNGDVVAIGPYLMKVTINKAEKEKKRKSQEMIQSAGTKIIEEKQYGSSLESRSEEAGHLLENATKIIEFPLKVELQPSGPLSTPSSKRDVSGSRPPSKIDPARKGSETTGVEVRSDSMAAAAGVEFGLQSNSDFETAEEDAKTKILDSSVIKSKLVFKDGDANYSELDLDQILGELTIGRGKDCTVVLNDKKSSRKNTIIRRVGLRFEIQDLGSVNGTFINGSKVDRQELSGGDRIRVGDIEFTFSARDQDYEQKAAAAVEMPIMDPELPSLPGNTNEGLPVLGRISTERGAVGFSPDLNINPGLTSAPGQLDFGQQPFGAVGITGVGGASVSSGKQSLVEKFKAQPMPRKILISVLLLGLVLFLMEEEEVPKVKKAKPSPSASGKVEKAATTFESLSAEQQRFVELQYQLAFDHLKNKEYDKTLYEVQKIFSLIPDFKEARSIERYAKDGKRKYEAIEDERRKKEDEARLRSKIQLLTEEIEALIKKEKFEEARIQFSDLIALDPENVNIERWKAQIDRYEQETVVAAERKKLAKEANARLRIKLQEADQLAAEKKFYPAIDAFQLVTESNAPDRSITQSAKRGIANVFKLIQDERDPILTEAKQLEQSGDESKAYKLFEKATQIDPKHPDGFEGMDRIRDLLHQRAKAIYTEAILAESYSDFATAKKKYLEVLEVVPRDDIYFDRAKRKLIPYVKSVLSEDGAP